ncbi:MAG: DUF6498-containing protein [Pseudomonadota bacterium]
MSQPANELRATPVDDFADVLPGTAALSGLDSGWLARPPGVLLVLVNLLPLVGVLLWDWDVWSVITLYWAENLVLGTYTLIKMVHAGLRLGRYVSGLYSACFFTLHYGAFCYGHGAFIQDLFGAPVSADTFGPLGIFARADQLWWWAVGALFVSHGVSLLFNYFGQGEYLRESPGSLMTSPYRRIVILHIAVLFGGLGVDALGSPVALIVVLVIVKTVVDLALHRDEHGREGRAYRARASGTRSRGRPPRPGGAA